MTVVYRTARFKGGKEIKEICEIYLDFLRTIPKLAVNSKTPGLMRYIDDGSKYSYLSTRDCLSNRANASEKQEYTMLWLERESIRKKASKATTD